VQDHDDEAGTGGEAEREESAGGGGRSKMGKWELIDAIRASRG
jgi:hypothetical protein